MNIPTTGMRKNPTMPSRTPIRVERRGTPDSRSLRSGIVYLMTWPAPMTTVEIVSTIQPVALCSSSAQTRIAAQLSSAPGSTGTTMPMMPTKIAMPTRTSAKVFTANHSAASPGPSSPHRVATMPYLHDLVVSLAAPWVVLSPRSGQLTGTGAEGVFAADRRLLSVLRLTVQRYVLQPVHADEYGAASAGYDAIVEGLGDAGHDATVTVRRTRELGASGRQEEGLGLTETIVLTNRSRSPVECDLTVALGTDLAGTAAVRSGAADTLPLREPEVSHSSVRWTDEDVVVTARLERRPDATRTVDGLLEASWRTRTEPGGSTTITIHVDLTAEPGTGFRIGPPAARPAYGVEVECDDSRVERWLQRSLDDAAGLMLSDGDDRYLGAGPPWYLTLFGRDSLISAAMMMAVDPGLAAGTLRALAGRQGTRVDPDAAEQPGKIPHELRATVADHGAGLVLPATYYGTHDATPLWIMTLHRAWRWGMPADEVADLLPALQAALGWLRDFADPDGDGFLEYIDESGHGLANQGWKDSRDAVQWPDGTLAEAPIALSEVQAYAYAAALAGADLLAAFGKPDEAWRTWAADLKVRFRTAFWIDDEQGGYPAIALDAAKRPVAGPASNMGHLLGTGILDPTDEAAVAPPARGGGPRQRLRPPHPLQYREAVQPPRVPHRQRLAARHRRRRSGPVRRGPSRGGRLFRGRNDRRGRVVRLSPARVVRRPRPARRTNPDAVPAVLPSTGVGGSFRAGRAGGGFGYRAGRPQRPDPAQSGKAVPVASAGGARPARRHGHPVAPDRGRRADRAGVSAKGLSTDGRGGHRDPACGVPTRQRWRPSGWMAAIKKMMSLGAPKLGAVRGPGYRSSSEGADVVGASASRPVSSWIVIAMLRSFSECSRPWWAQNSSSPPLVRVTRT